MSELQIIRVQGEEIAPYISELAQLRITVFKDYPYLYLGDLEYEKKYLKTYLQCPQSAMVLALDHVKVVGASTAIPLIFETDEFKQPFINKGMKVEEIFYFGESVLLPAYRGRKVYRHFFQGREDAARAYGSRIATFCAVDRKADDPRKPADYVPLDAVWQHFGYTKQPDLHAYFSWTEVGETTESPKQLTFWMKNL